MNKNLLIVSGVLVVLAVGVGSYMLMIRNSNISTTNILDQVTSKKTENISEKSLAELLVVKEAQKCTVEHAADMTKSSGVAYLANGKIRGDYDVSVGGRDSKVHFIIDKENIHTWIDAVPVGFKVSMMTAKNYSKSPNSQMPDINQKLAYSCTPWIVDFSMFVLPSSIAFTSI